MPRATLAGQLGGEALQAPQVVAVVLQRNLEIAIDSHVPVSLVATGQSALYAVQGVHVTDQHQAGRSPLVKRVVEVNPAEIGSVVGEEVERRVLAGGDGADSGHVAVSLGCRQVAREAAQI